MGNEQNKPSSRSGIGMLILIVGLTLYAFLAAAIGELFEDLGLAVQMIYYLIAGIVWIFPVKKLLQWMGGNPKA